MRTINKYMSNGDIYSTALTLAQNFKDTEELFPVAIIYSIQKNIQTNMSGVIMLILKTVKN